MIERRSIFGNGIGLLLPIVFFATIQSKDIVAYRDARLKEVGTAAVRHELALLSHLFMITVKEWGMGNLVNPVQQIRKPAPKPGRERRLSPEEEKALLIECAKYKKELSSIVRFALETAGRRSEIAEMKWEHVNLDKKTVKLKEKQFKHKETIYRNVPLSPVAIKILKELPRRIDGNIWSYNANYFTLSFIRVVSRARASYVKEFEEKNNEKKLPIRILSFSLISHFTIYVTRLQVVSSKKA
ncbi:MAG: tyrosine-type recombinase/integrase [Nitrospirota bacterium]|nr:tyrosine-type recombinase/integrase [Nitrospirota bacterium]